MRSFRPRLTYANVVASLSLFLVLAGGSAFAANQLAKNSVGANQIKKNAVTTAKIKKEAVAGGKIKNGAVTNAKLADKAVTGAKIDTTTLPAVPTATTADNLSGLYFAVVKSDGTLVRGTAGVSSESAGGATYRVKLPAGTDTKKCFFVGSMGGSNTGEPEIGQISLNPSGTVNAIYITTANGGGVQTPKEFTVLARC